MADDRPNILFITSDQHRADFLGCAGHPYVRTPHLDRLALAGTRFTRAHVDCPVCIPARTALITGRRAWENGKAEYSDTFRVDRPTRNMLGGLLTEAGYQTELVGKTHWNTEPDCRGGFEHVTWLATLRREQMLFEGRGGKTTGLGYNEISPGLCPLPPHLQQANWTVNEGLDFLATRERAQPFALWLSFQDPHPPLTIHEPFYSMYRGLDAFASDPPSWIGSDREPNAIYEQRLSCNPPGVLSDAEMRHAREVYAGMITNLDHQLGRVIASLMHSGDFENTLIVYTSDHGEFLGDFGLVHKRQFLSQSVNVPLIVRPPESWKATPGLVTDALVEWVDLLPTFCEAAGARVPDDVSGRSLRPVITGESATHREFLHGQLGRCHMLHTGEHKYLYFTDDGRELAFDDGNERDLLDPATTAMLRQHFTRVLRDSKHPDVSADGTLRNDGAGRPDAATLRANFGVLGLGGINYIEDDLLRRVQPIG